MEDGVVALLRYTLDMRADGRIPDSDALDARLEKMVRGWVPAVEAALVRHIEPARAARLALRHAATFPAPSPSMNDAQDAAEAILRLPAFPSPHARSVRLYRSPAGAPPLHLYPLRRPVYPSAPPPPPPPLPPPLLPPLPH